jgi:hypothetical protein
MIIQAKHLENQAKMKVKADKGASQMKLKEGS